MISLISEMLSYPFMVKAIFVGLLISISSALLGITLVLKRYA
ncbi:MAG: metal ABC transporter permease, partial [Parvimonas micra]|nr:metal ABC transporter permease [Parvimonas micra]